MRGLNGLLITDFAPFNTAPGGQLVMLGAGSGYWDFWDLVTRLPGPPQFP